MKKNISIAIAALLGFIAIYISVMGYGKIEESKAFVQWPEFDIGQNIFDNNSSPILINGGGVRS